MALYWFSSVYLLAGHIYQKGFNRCCLQTLYVKGKIMDVNGCGKKLSVYSSYVAKNVKLWIKLMKKNITEHQRSKLFTLECSSNPSVLLVHSAVGASFNQSDTSVGPVSLQGHRLETQPGYIL